MVGAISAGLQVLGAGMNIIQGINAKKDQRDAERAAQEYLTEAKRKIEVNRLEEVQVPLDAYGLQTQAMMAGQQQNIEALREAGQRGIQGGLAATQAVTQQGLENQRQEMAQDIYKRDLMIAQEDARIDQQLANLNLQQADAAQIAAAQNEQIAAQSFSGAIKGLGAAAQTAYENSALYGNQTNRIMKQYGSTMSRAEKKDVLAGLSASMLDRAAMGEYNPFTTAGLTSGATPIQVDNTITTSGIPGL